MTLLLPLFKYTFFLNLKFQYYISVHTVRISTKFNLCSHLNDLAIGGHVIFFTFLLILFTLY